MPISYTKINSSNLPSDLVPRPRLEALLTRGLDQRARLFLITAAAGFGKSTLVNAWLQENSIQNYWINLESSEDDPAIFASLLLQALGEEDTSLSKERPPQKILEEIIQHAQQAERTSFFIFDRIENIRNRKIHDMIFSLAGQLPARKGIVIISRKNPVLPVSRMRASNQLVEIDEQDLRFNLNETRQFIEQQIGCPLPTGNLDAIYQKTLGWIAGLRLAVDQLASDLAMENSLAVRNYSGAARFMADYFNEEVFSKENSAMQDFMVKSSVLEEFSESLCNTVIPGGNVENPIATLAENHIFSFSVENRSGWFRYHPLFRDFLVSKCSPDERQAIYKKTSQWFQQHNQPREAVEYGLRSGDESTAMEIIEPACDQAILEGDIANLANWLESWARNGFAPRAELLVYQGWINALKGDFVQAIVMTERAEEMLKNRSKGKKNGDAVSLQVTSGKLAALRAFIEVMYTHQYDAALKEARNAQKLLPRNRSAWNLMALWAQAETQKRNDHISKSIETLYEALRIGKSVGGKTFTYAIVNSLAAALHFNGQRGEALDVCQKAIARSADPEDPSLGGIYAWIGRLNFEANRLDLAREFIEKGQKLNDQAGVSLNSIFCHYYASQIYQASGEAGRALDSIKHAQSLAGSVTLSDESWLNAWDANLNMMQGNMLHVEHWVRREGPALTQKPVYLNMEMMLVYARYLVQIGEMNEAAKRLREMEKQANRRGYFRWLLSIYLLQGIIWDHNGKKPQALECIKRAIHIAAPEEYQRAFLDENPVVLKLVPELSQESPAFIMRLLRSASSLNASEKKIPASILPEPLSERENEILHLLIKGKKGPQISDELFISYSTVRTHIKSIHRKLDVHTRHELIEKARLLELA